MKHTLTILIASFAVTVGLLASPEQMREDIDSEIPLEKALADFNSTYPDPNPITVDEVIASIRNLKTADPEISDAMFDLYQAVVERGVLPKGMYFSTMTALIDGEYTYEVDWRDLTWTNLPRSEPHPVLGWGYNHRIRARFVSSRKLTSEEKAEQERMRSRGQKHVEQNAAGQPATRLEPK